MRVSDGVEIYTTLELIRHFGTRVSNIARKCCEQWTLYAIRYPDGRGTVYLCSRCDVERV